jgi:hypothetical protein
MGPSINPTLHTPSQQQGDVMHLKRNPGWIDTFLSRLFLPAIPYVKPSPVQILAWSGLMTLAFITYLSQLNKFQVAIYYDDADYIILADSLFKSNSYGLINSPGEVINERYPFGFPLILSPIRAFLPDNLEALKIPSLLATLLIMTILFWGWRVLSRSLSYWWAIAVIGLFSIDPTTVDLSRQLRSEPLFMLFMIIMILAAEKITQDRPHWGWIIIFGIASAMVVFTRTIGAAPILGIVVYIILTRKKGVILRGLLGMVSAVLFTLIILGLTPVRFQDLLPSVYLTENNAVFLKRLIPLSNINSPGQAEQSQPELSGDGNEPMNFDFILMSIQQRLEIDLRNSILAIGGGESEQNLANRLGLPFLPKLLGIFISILILIGYFLWIKREGLTGFNFSSLVYLFALFFWVWDGRRFLYPIQPQLILAFLLTIEASFRLVASLYNRQRSTGRIHPQAFPSVMVILVIMILFIPATIKSFTLYDSRVVVGDVTRRTLWIKDHTAPDSIILSEIPEMDYVYSGRLTVRYPRNFTNKDEMINLIREKGIDYILLAPQLGWDESGYSPEYSNLAKQFFPLFKQLEEQGMITIVFISTDDLVTVYRVEP